MYRTLRQIHKWVGVICFAFLALIAATGYFLAMKDRFAWVRPETMDGTPVETLGAVISIEQASEAAFTAGYAELTKPEHVDRLEYRAKENIYKVLSKDGYREVQVDAATGEVLSKAQRNDQLMEDIHDLGFISDWVHAWLLPWIAAALFFLSISGIVMYFVPVFRRWKFKKEGGKAKTPG